MDEFKLPETKPSHDDHARGLALVAAGLEYDLLPTLPIDVQSDWYLKLSVCSALLMAGMRLYHSEIVRTCEHADISTVMHLGPDKHTSDLKLRVERGETITELGVLAALKDALMLDPDRASLGLTPLWNDLLEGLHALLQGWRASGMDQEAVHQQAMPVIRQRVEQTLQAHMGAFSIRAEMCALSLKSGADPKKLERAKEALMKRYPELGLRSSQATIPGTGTQADLNTATDRARSNLDQAPWWKGGVRTDPDASKKDN